MLTRRMVLVALDSGEDVGDPLLVPVEMQTMELLPQSTSPRQITSGKDSSAACSDSLVSS